MTTPSLSVNLNALAGRPDEGPPRPPFTEVSPGEWHFKIDNSTLEKFMGCPKAAEFYVMRRREALPSAALAFGGAIHEGLDQLYRLGFTDQALESARTALMTCMTERPTAGCDWRTAEFGLQVLDRYFKHYRNDELTHTIYRHNDKPFIEQAFTIELGLIEFPEPTPFPGYTRAALLGPDCERGGESATVRTIRAFYTGKVDLANHKGGRVWITDHKTTTVLGQSFWDQFELSPQTLGYTWAFREITGEQPAGAIINCLALRKPTPSGRPIRFERQSFFYAPEKVDEWKDDTMTLVADFLSHAIRGKFPRARLWCINKYGKCRYHNVCAAPNASRDSILNSSEFSNVTWDPTT